jgi:hypothetical protein
MPHCDHAGVAPPIPASARRGPPALDPRCAELELLCVALAEQACHAPARLAALAQRDELQTQLDLLESGGADFARAAVLGLQLTTLRQASVQLPLSEEDYLTLPDRHAALVQKVTTKCDELRNEDRRETALTSLSGKLDQLKGVDLTAFAHGAAGNDTHAGTSRHHPCNLCCGFTGLDIVRASVTPTTPSAHDAAKLYGLQRECSTLLQLVSAAPTVRQVLQRKHRVQAQIGGLEAAEEVDYSAVGDLLLQLESLDLQSARLPMTEEDDMTLKNRHAALVETVTAVCRELMKAKQYAALRDMAAQLGALKAVDVTTLHSCDAESPEHQ